MHIGSGQIDLDKRHAGMRSKCFLWNRHDLMIDFPDGNVRGNHLLVEINYP